MTTRPDTGISGVYEVFLGVDDEDFARRYFSDFGFAEIAVANYTAAEAERCYGHRSALRAIRLQNGAIDSHGLLRLLIWQQPAGPGVGYAPPTAIGQRMAVMRTADIWRLIDIYQAAREAGQPWLATEPIVDDLFGLDDNKKDFFNRPITVRESGVYGEFFNHVFFQRYGYQIPGYGTIDEHSPLRTSEFTHHDFILRGNIKELDYLETIFGLQPEDPPQRNGDWQKGPRTVFQFKPGESHEYWGFVSPNNICGKLKFFTQQPHQPDFSDCQQLGRKGITAHSFYLPNLEAIHQKAHADKRLRLTDILDNEFGEKSCVIRDTLGCTWQLIEKLSTNHQPITDLQFEKTSG